jgi:hypothetical protein
MLTDSLDITLHYLLAIRYLHANQPVTFIIRKSIHSIVRTEENLFIFITC